jgi:hypothetical protein
VRALAADEMFGMGAGTAESRYIPLQLLLGPIGVMSQRTTTLAKEPNLPQRLTVSNVKRVSAVTFCPTSAAPVLSDMTAWTVSSVPALVATSFADLERLSRVILLIEKRFKQRANVVETCESKIYGQDIPARCVIPTTDAVGDTRSNI